MANINTVRVRPARGFTLIEIMVVLAIVAIIAAIAVPAYTDMIRKSRRADAVDMLTLVQSLQEKYRASNTTYGTLVQLGLNDDATSATWEPSNEGHYRISFSVAGTATAYTVIAQAINDQANDDDCWRMGIQVDASNPRGLKGSRTSSSATWVTGANSPCW